MMQILVKSDDFRSGRKATGSYGQHRSQWVKVVYCKLTSGSPMAKFFPNTAKT